MVRKILMLALAASAAFSSAFAAAPGCTVAISPTKGTFTGNQIKPTVTRVVCGEDEITNFTVTYGENINAGDNAGSVFVTVKGNTDPIEKTFKIAKGNIEIKIDDAQKEKGTDDPEFTWHINDEENLEFNADTLKNLKKSLAKTIKLTREKGEDIVNSSNEPRTYQISLAEGVYDALVDEYKNYSIDYTTGNFSITKTKVVVAAKGCGKVYGEEDPKLEYTVNGNISEKDYTKLGKISVTRTSGENVGKYDIKVSVQYEETTDYIVETINSIFGITPATATVTVNDVEKTYGDATPEITYETKGLVGKDKLTTPTISCKKCQSNGLEPVGEYAVNLVFDESKNPNYNINVVSGLLTVTPRPITVTVKDAEKTYGDDDPTFELDVDDLVSDKEKLEGATITRAEGEDVGTYKVSVTFAKGSNSNYSMTVKSGTLTISAKAVTLTVDNVSKKFGEKDPELTYTVKTLVGKDALDGVTITREKGEDAGTYAITASVDKKLNPNYVVTVGDDGVFTIKPNDDKIVVTITGHVDTVEYDGKLKTVKGYDMECNSEAYSLDFVEYTGKAETSGTNAAKYLMGLSKDDFKNTSVNYPNVTFAVTDGYLYVKPRALVVTATSEKITYGEETPTEFTWTVDNLIEGDELDNIHVSLTKSTTGLLAAGEYELSFDKKSPTNKNYVVSEYVTGALKVEKRIVTVTVADTSKVYGQKDPETYRYETSGLLEGDELKGLIIAREAGENVLKTVETKEDSAYRISATFAEGTELNPNYLLKVKQGYFTIMPYTEPVKVIIIGNTITMKYTGEEITVEKSFDVIPYNDGSAENPLPAEYAYTKEFVAYTGTPTVSGTNKYLYPMNLDVSEFVNISPNFEHVSFILSGDGTLIINETGPVSIAAGKTVQKLGISTIGRAIQVSGSTVGSRYAVVDMQGRVVRKGVVGSANFEIQVPTSGVYMVRVGSSAKRVHIK